MISEDVESRLYNFKVKQALDRMWEQDEPVTVEEREMVTALAATYGDVGWFAGAISTVLWAAVKYICETPKRVMAGDEPLTLQSREGTL